MSSNGLSPPLTSFPSHSPLMHPFSSNYESKTLSPTDPPNSIHVPSSSLLPPTSSPSVSSSSRDSTSLSVCLPSSFPDAQHVSDQGNDVLIPNSSIPSSSPPSDKIGFVLYVEKLMGS